MKHRAFDPIEERLAGGGDTVIDPSATTGPIPLAAGTWERPEGDKPAPVRPYIPRCSMTERLGRY